MKTALGTYSSRKIEQKMCEAVATRRNWQNGNTEVWLDVNGQLKVGLHGNVIAIVVTSGRVMPCLDTLKTWPTPTTMSRLRALGVHVYQRKGRVYLDDVEV